MTFATTYNIPLGQCVICGGEIINRRPNAIYCHNCITGARTQLHPRAQMRNITVSLTYDQVDFVDWLASKCYSSRSEAVRDLLNDKLEVFRKHAEVPL